jgi:Zn finger protein HypA/HybF involved in hydrogenase expression
VHETGLVRRLVEAARRIAAAEGGGHILEVAVKVGALTGISAAHLRDHWVEEVRGTPLEGAELKVACSDDPTDADADGVILESVQLRQV